MVGELRLDKVDKHGNINMLAISSIIEYLQENQTIILPVDGIYCTAAKLNTDNFLRFREMDMENILVMVRDFKDLEKYSRICKKEYDFLHRLWPDDVYVRLHSNLEGGIESDFFFYIPKTGYLLEILNNIDEPMMCSFRNNDKHKPYYSEHDIKEHYSDIADNMIIIHQYCKEHLCPTLIDIRNEKIQIICKGRVDDEDIKSLYYL
jgi:tRNA A37 threonylcarbamoyladenosine synthetase subunit TsaC/SUA5/YrdC